MEYRDFVKVQAERFEGKKAAKLVKAKDLDEKQLQLLGHRLAGEVE
jgi:hypothetical protein